MQLFVEVQEKIEEGLQGVHGMSVAGGGVAVLCVPLTQLVQRIIVRATVFATCDAAPAM